MVISATNTAKHYVVMGGTFDPVHDGHIKSAQQLAKVMGYAHIYMMPCGDAYHKRGASHAKHRVAMLKQALAHQSTLLVDPRETLREGATYTVDTLIQLRKELGEAAHICWVLGTDAAKGLTQWQDWTLFFQLANLIVINRAGDVLADQDTHPWPAKQEPNIERFKQQANGCLMQVALEPVAVSSTEIRQALRKQEPVDGHVPQPVMNYIELHGLYRGKN
jgi:nicotinate-nucleotide adenylyltransferase